MSLSLNFHGVRVGLSASSPIASKALEWIAEDFGFFKASGLHDYEIEFRLVGTPAPFKCDGVPLFKTRMCRAFGLAQRRVCDYGDGSVVESLSWKSGRRVLNIFSQNENELYEFTYVALLSTVGEALDRKGFHRVHALGVTNSKSSFLLLLPQGGGKSTLAATFSKRGIPISILSDESPLLKDGVAYPFPTHIALEDKLSKNLGLKNARLFQRKYFPSKSVFEIPRDKIASPKPLHGILIGRRGNGRAFIKPLSPSQVFLELFKGIVVGVGLAQMAEFLLRGNNVFGLVRIALSRFQEMIRTVRTVPCYEFTMGTDIEENVRVLQNFVQPEAKQILSRTVPELQI